MQRQIQKKGNRVLVHLPADWLLTQKLQVPAGDKSHTSHVTFGQMIEMIALAHINLHARELAAYTRNAKVEYKDGGYVVTFFRDIEDL
jgi:hypothetical protein